MASTSNPCCAQWKMKCEKMEGRRRLFRETITFLDGKVKSLENDNLNLQKACDELQRRANVLEEEKEKEASFKGSLEKEISALKIEICSIKSNAACKTEDSNNDATLLRTCISEKELDIDRLRRLLAEEKTRADAEKEAADSERKKAAELQNALHYEKSRSDEARKLADTFGRKTEESRCQLESLRNEVKSMSLKLEEANRMLEAEKQREVRDKKYADEELARSVEQGRISEENENRLAEEMGRANNLSMKLEEERQRADKLQKELQQVMSSHMKPDLSFQLEELSKNLEAEKKNVLIERKRAELEMSFKEEQKKIAEANIKKAMEYKCSADKLSQDLESSRQRVESLEKELKEMNCILESERKALTREKKITDTLKLKSEEQKKKAEANNKKAKEDKCHADKLSQDLESSRQRVESLEKELKEMNCILESERKALAREKKITDTLKLKSEEQKKKAEANFNKAEEEKCHADKVSQDLESSRQRVENLEKQLNEVNFILESERKAFAREKKTADTLKLKLEEEKKVTEDHIKIAMEEKCHADKLSQDLQNSRHQVESLEEELNKVNNILEVERKALAEEKDNADILKLKSEEHEKLAIENEVRAVEEKRRGDTLVQELDNARKKLNDMENELCEIKQSKGLSDVSSAPPNHALKKQISKNNLLREHLKLEKKRVKYFEQVAELEKERNSMLQQELDLSKRDCQRMVQHLDMLSDTFGAKYRVNNVAKRPRLSNVECMQLAERMLDRSPSSQMDVCCDAVLRTSSLSSRDGTCNMKPSAGAAHAGRCTVSPSGMVNDLEPLLGGSRGDLLPSSALNSNTASFSDEQLMGSQERAAGSLTTSAGLAVKNTNHPAMIPRWNDGERAVTITENGMRLAEFDVGHDKKRRKTVDELESIKMMHIEGKRIFQEAETKLLALHKAVVLPVIENKKENVPVTDNNANLFRSSDLSCKKRKAADELEVVLQEKENVPLTNNNANSFGNSDLSCKKGKATDELELVLQGVDCSTVHIEMDERKSLDPISTSIREICQSQEAAGRDQVVRNQDTLVGTKLLALQKTLVLPVIELKEKENVPVTDNNANSFGSSDLSCHKRKAMDELEVVRQEKENVPLTNDNANSFGSSDLSCKKGKATDELEVALQGVDCSTLQVETDKCQSLDPISTSIRDIFQPREAAGRDQVFCNQDTLLRFEQEMNGDYMKLLDLDDAVAEEHYRMAMAMPLSPTLPDLDEVEFQMHGANLSACNNANDVNGSMPDENQIFCIVFSDMEDVGIITRIFCATRTCLDRLHLSSQTSWLVKDILVALQSQEDLRPRERVCALFSLLLLNLSRVSCVKAMDLQSQELLGSFTTDIQSALSNVDRRDLFAKICDPRDLLDLCEDFLLHKGILLQNSTAFESSNHDDSFIEILLEGNNSALRPKIASTNLLVAGCVIMASISVVVGVTGCVCEVSLKIISLSTADDTLALALLILHVFAYICGEEYFNGSSYCSAMKVVKYFVMTTEGLLANKCIAGIQPGDGTWPHFTACDRCPFSEASICLGDVSSELLEKLERLQTSLNIADSAYSSNVESLSGFLGVALSSLELIAAKMSWDWVCSTIVPKLFKMLGTCNKENIVSTALVVLLGDLGRLGVEVGGYDNAGVKNIRQQLLRILCQTSISKCYSFSIAAVQALIGLRPEGKAGFLKNNVEVLAEGALSACAASNFVVDIQSWLSCEKSLLTPVEF